MLNEISVNDKIFFKNKYIILNKLLKYDIRYNYEENSTTILTSMINSYVLLITKQKPVVPELKASNSNIKVTSSNLTLIF